MPEYVPFDGVESLILGKSSFTMRFSDMLCERPSLLSCCLCLCDDNLEEVLIW